MVDRDVLLRKSEAIEHHTSRLRAKLPLSASALDGDESLLNDVCFDTLQAIQACIDLAALADRLAKAAGLRNLLVHRYADLASSRLVDAVSAGLDDLDEFAAALRRHSGPR